MGLLRLYYRMLSTPFLQTGFMLLTALVLTYGIYLSHCSNICWGTGIRRLMRGMATLPQGNQQLLVVTDKVRRPQVSLG